MFLFLFCDIEKSNNIHAELGVPLGLVSQQIGIGSIKLRSKYADSVVRTAHARMIALSPGSWS